MATSEPPADPWDWGVEDVVAALCRSDSPWLQASRVRLAFPPNFEAILRQNDVSGEVLLTIVDYHTLQDKLGVSSLGQQHAILKIVRTLRGRSPKFQEEFQSEDHGSIMPAYAPLPSFSGSPPRYIGFSPHSWMSSMNGFLQSPVRSPMRVLNSEHPTLLPAVRTREVQQEEEEDQGSQINDPTETRGAARPGEVHILLDGRKRRKLELKSPETPLNGSRDSAIISDTEFDNVEQLSANQVPTSSVQNGVESDDPSVAHNEVPHDRDAVLPEETVVKVPTTAPDLPIQEELPFIPVATSADDPGVRSSIEDSHNVDSTMHDSALPSTEKKEKKRIAPTLISQASQDEETEKHSDESGLEIAHSQPPLHKRIEIDKNKALVHPKHDRLPIYNSYLGIKASPVDDIFYDNVQFGEELKNDRHYDIVKDPQIAPDPENFCFISRSTPLGQRLYVSNLMKHFLHSPAETGLERTDGKVYAVQPYKPSIGRRHHNQSVTVFSVDRAGNVRATREDMRHYLEISALTYSKGKANQVDTQKPLFNIPGDNPFRIDKSDTGNHDWDFLEKWQYMDGGEKILPLYGDSGSENEYDLDTWQTMEEELGAIERPLGRAKTKFLSEVDIRRIVDEVVTELVRKWKEVKLPVKQRKAYSMWTKSRVHRTKDVMIADATSRVEFLNKRLDKMYEEITKEVWSSASKLKRQCKILEVTVFEREDLVWKISVLESRKQPAKPHPKARKLKSVKVATAPEEDEGDDGDVDILETSEEPSSSEGDLDDFIEPDSQDDTDLDVPVPTGDDPIGDIPAYTEELGDETEEDIVTPTRRRRLPNRPVPSESTPTNSGPSSPLLSQLSPSLQRVERLHTKNGAISTPSSPSHQPSAPVQPELPTRPRTKFEDPGSEQNSSRVIDLTISSDDIEESDGPDRAETPLINSPSHNPFDESREQLATPVSIKSLYEVDSRSEASLNGYDREELPGYDDIASIRTIDWATLSERKDRRRLLIKILAKTSKGVRDRLIKRLNDVRRDDIRHDILGAMMAFLKKSTSIPGFDDATAEVVCELTSFYICWSECQFRDGGWPAKTIRDAMDQLNTSMFSQFYNRLREEVKRYTIKKEPKSEPMGISVRNKGKGKLIDESEASDVELTWTPHKKRKRAVKQDERAVDMQNLATERLKLQKRRKQELVKRLQDMGGSIDTAQIIVNLSKAEDEDFIYINPRIGSRIKPHQIEGVQFMWREVIVGGGGCTLGMAMGLGKTMQAITLLVTIAESASSPNEKIYKQIPEDLRHLRALILCPPGLIDNWTDEILMWADPKPESGYIENLFRVDSTLHPRERLLSISAWYDQGGLLIMSYDLFRSYIHNQATAGREPPLNSDEHGEVYNQLTEGPNIVISDESHRLKNTKSKLALAASQFKTSRRVALTGSPLANNLTEYWSLVTWTSPGYLGDLVQFNAKYTEPIEEGSFAESSYAERRKSLKMLHVLKNDLEPKVLRADIDVLKDSLPGKTEFVIKVPLTDLQNRAYTLFVDAMLPGLKDDERVGNATLWAWLSLLQLLCNHPKCFKEKLLMKIPENLIAQNKGKPKKLSFGKPEDSDDRGEENPGEQDVISMGIPQKVIQTLLKFFASLEGEVDLELPSHSYKVQIFLDILDAAKMVGDKVLVFSHSIPTLNFLENLVHGRSYKRLDGKTKMSERQQATKEFNSGNIDIYLISTRAGGLGLNLYGANRCIIFDMNWNPAWEVQAVGRAYRIGQQKPVFVYRFTAGGTFEDKMHDKAVWKLQLASRVIDKKNPTPHSSKLAKDYLFRPKPVEPKDLTEFQGKDLVVLDKMLADQSRERSILSIELTETFTRDDDAAPLTAAELAETQVMIQEEQLKRRDPGAYQRLQAERDRSRSTADVTRPNTVHGGVTAHGQPISSTVPRFATINPSASASTPSTQAEGSSFVYGSIPRSTTPRGHPSSGPSGPAYGLFQSPIYDPLRVRPTSSVSDSHIDNAPRNVIKDLPKEQRPISAPTMVRETNKNSVTKDGETIDSTYLQPSTNTAPSESGLQPVTTATTKVTDNRSTRSPSADQPATHTGQTVVENQTPSLQNGEDSTNYERISDKQALMDRIKRALDRSARQRNEAKRASRVQQT